MPIVRLLQSRVEPQVFFLFLEKFRESHLSTLLYIFPSSPPLLRTTFPPFPRPLWGAPDHPERIVAALGSPKAQGQRGPRVVYAAVYAARAGKPRPLGLLPELLTKISTINYLEM